MTIEIEEIRTETLKISVPILTEQVFDARDNGKDNCISITPIFSKQNGKEIEGYNVEYIEEDSYYQDFLPLYKIASKNRQNLRIGGFNFEYLIFKGEPSYKLEKSYFRLLYLRLKKKLK